MGLLDQSTITQPTFTPVSANETVQGQLNNVLDSNNPLMERAKTRALQSANKRGLLNSSLGVQAGEEAVLTAALPIAQQDAQTYKDRTQLGDDWQNKFGLEGNAYQYKSALSDQENTNALAQIGEQGSQTRLNIGSQSTADIAKISEQGVQSRLNIGSQSGADLAKIQEQGLQERTTGLQQYQQQVGEGNFSTGLIGANLAAEQRLQQDRLAHEATQNELQRGFQSTESAAQRAHESTLQTEQLTQQERNLTAELSTKWNITEAEIASRLELTTQQIKADADRQGVQITHEAAMNEARNTLDRELQTERLASQEGISTAEMQNRLDIQANDISATEAQYLAQIASQEGISEAELANRLALSTAEITSRELLTGNQIAHEAALAEAKNELETDLQKARIASQEGITEAELQNRLDIQTNQIAATEGQYLAEIASREQITTDELANRLALSEAEITSRELLAGNQITHEAALAEAKNQLETDLQVARIASQEGITEAELQNKLDMQAADITANEAQYLAQIASQESITADELANKLSIITAEITSRETLAGNQITHEAALAKAKNQLEKDLLSDRIIADKNAATAAHDRQVGYTDADGVYHKGEIDVRYENELAIAKQQGTDALKRVQEQIKGEKALARQQYEQQVGWTDEDGVDHGGVLDTNYNNELKLIQERNTSAEKIATWANQNSLSLTEARGVNDRALLELQHAQEYGLSDPSKPYYNPVTEVFTASASRTDSDGVEYANIDMSAVGSGGLAAKTAAELATIAASGFETMEQVRERNASAENIAQWANNNNLSAIEARGIQDRALSELQYVQEVGLGDPSKPYYNPETGEWTNEPTRVGTDSEGNEVYYQNVDASGIGDGLIGARTIAELTAISAQGFNQLTNIEAQGRNAVVQIQEGGVQDRAMESLRFAQDIGVSIPGFDKDVYLNPNTGELTDQSSYRPTEPPAGLSASDSVDWQRENIDLLATAEQVMTNGEKTYGQRADELMLDPDSFAHDPSNLERFDFPNGQNLLEYIGYDASVQQGLTRDQIIHVSRMFDGMFAAIDTEVPPILYKEVQNVQVGSNGKTGRMAVQLANDLAKMDADTTNRVELTAAEYAAKGTLSAQEHTQFLAALSKEYGLQDASQATKEAGLNYRQELSAESTRLATQAGLDQSAMKLMTSLEETQMEQWVEINKMVFDPDDPEADAVYRQKSIDALNSEYAERKSLISDTVSALSNWDWTVTNVEKPTTYDDGTKGTTTESTSTVSYDGGLLNTGV